MERIIIQQHDLEVKGIAQHEIKKILERSKFLLVLDDYDEYKKGTNSDIDAVISGKRGNCFVLITSRPDYMDKKDKKNLDGEIQIRGLSNKGVTECIDRYFDKERLSQPTSTNKDPQVAKVNTQDLIVKARRRGVFRLLKIPLLLLMLSVLHVETGDLPARRTDIMWEIIQIYIKRAKRKGVKLENQETILQHLGELSYDASQRDTNQLKIRKVK